MQSAVRGDGMGWGEGSDNGGLVRQHSAGLGTMQPSTCIDEEVNTSQVSQCVSNLMGSSPPSFAGHDKSRYVSTILLLSENQVSCS
jgi:hypothetical protein